MVRQQSYTCSPGNRSHCAQRVTPEYDCDRCRGNRHSEFLTQAVFQREGRKGRRKEGRKGGKKENSTFFNNQVLVHNKLANHIVSKTPGTFSLYVFIQVIPTHNLFSGRNYLNRRD